MNNVDLFSFTFVDREKQTQRVKDILGKKNFKNVIWIYGNHGVGKSYFVKHATSEVSDNMMVHIELKADNKTTNCLGLLLDKIGNVTHNSFMSFFQKNYKVISKLMLGAVCTAIQNITKIDLNALLGAVLDGNNLFINQNNQQQNNLKLIISYLDTILTQQNLLIIIDDLSFCDMRSFDLLINILQYYSASKNQHICFVLCTSHENSYNNIEYELQEKIVLEPIEIKPFENYKYFNDILIRKFNLATTTPHTIEQIFQFCEGYPQRLKDFVHVLYGEGGIIFSELCDRAVWKDEIVESIILENHDDFRIKEMTYVDQFILYIVIEFQKNLPLEIIIDLVEYIKTQNQIFFIDCSKQEIISAVMELKNKGILDLCRDRNRYLVKMDHDLKYYRLKKQLSNDPMLPRINGIFFEYIIENKNRFFDSLFTPDDIAELLAWHSYYGRTTNWIKYNLDFGIIQYESGDFKNASETFQRLENYFEVLETNQKLIIGDCFFRAGEYRLAKTLLERFTPTKKQQSYPYYLLLTRVYNLLFEKEKVIDVIDHKLLPTCENDEIRLHVLNLKQRILSTMKDKRDEAKQIFDALKKDTPLYVQDKSIYGKFLLGSIEFYRGDIANKDLSRAEEIAKATDNQYLLAIFYVNNGFHEFWQGNIACAKENFQIAQDRLSSIRIHEISYPLNNLGVCYLMEGKVDDAINCFQMGLIWNKSKYVEITLKTWLMVCYALTENDNCFVRIEELKGFLNDSNITDISIHIKVNSLIGFAYKCFGDMEQYDEYRKKALHAIKAHSKENLPYIWLENYDKDIENYITAHVNKQQYPFFYEKRFEPWLVTLIHD